MFKNWGKRRKYVTAPKRVDRFKTRQPFLDDTDEESLASTTSVSSESDFQSDSSGSESSDDGARKRTSSAAGSSDSDGRVAARTRRKRSSAGAAALELSRRRKSGAGRRPVRRKPQGSDKTEDVQDEDEPKPDAKENQEKDSEDDDGGEEDDGPSVVRSSEEERLNDSDSLKDFIVDDNDQKGKEEGEEGPAQDVLSQLPPEFITGSQLTHFHVVVKALLINALDDNFLKSLYSGERTKRYAEEMKSSLHYFDERLVLPRLENLKQRSRWKERFKERVECYPEVRITATGRGHGCEACELDRNGRYLVRLSGQLYHSSTLQQDQFMPDDVQSFHVGSVCASRAEVYHALKHFKYHLFTSCRTAMEEQSKKLDNKERDEEEPPVKDTVKKVFAVLQENGWIDKQYETFQEHLNNADFFQEEKLD
ncbi:coiled-coil domain-containing protein 82 isoform X2 [Denticeps clupeoides]|uniref:coiled-coil domain-containing protein 82 isoform X2 n=1 Tax=Denticeps clupeoides TaxID=299321 RepID=UPI0010A3A553|nr:coiled-coil domain-containing protein 82 isoform X2 [Denticeps clupeoides]